MQNTLEKKKPGPKSPTKYTVPIVSKIADALEKYVQDTKLPFIKTFCAQYSSQYNKNIKDPTKMISLHPVYFTDLESFTDHIRFMSAFSSLKAKVERTLILDGIYDRKTNGFIIDKALKNMCGWRDDPSTIIDQSQHAHVELSVKIDDNKIDENRTIELARET